MNNKPIISIGPLGFPWQTSDPFLFCAYHRDEYPSGNGQMGVEPAALAGRNVGQDFQIKDGWRMYHGKQVPGFPYHPHRGFETITINKEGFVDHSDSLGAAGRFGEGDVQWMAAGKGVLHSEMFPLIHEDRDNPLEIFQVWLNLPARSKMVDPHFKMLWKDMIPTIHQKDAEGRITSIDVIAGNFGGETAPSPTPDSWASNPENGVMVMTIRMSAGSTWTIPASALQGVNRTLYFYRGDQVQIGQTNIPSDHLVQIDPNQAIEVKNTGGDAYFLFLQGRPINEPVAQYGPFVMNTQEETQQAFEDYRRTQFGGWPWPQQEQIHSKDKGRFALHADGTEEIKSS